MSEPPAKRSKAAQGRNIKDLSEPDTPEIELVETVTSPSSALGKRPWSSMDPGESKAEAQLRAIAHAHARLQRLRNIPNHCPPYGPHGSHDLSRPQNLDKILADIPKIPRRPPPSKAAFNQRLQNEKFNRDRNLDPRLRLDFIQNYSSLIINFGDNAPSPRWLVAPVTRPLGTRNVGDLGAPSPPSTPNERAVWNGSEVREVRVPASQNPNLGILEWKFDAGPPVGWQGLAWDKVYAYAYKYLENALSDPIFRDQVRATIVNGPHAKFVAGVEDPLPGLPAPPKTNHFETQPGPVANVDDSRYFYPSYDRPSLAMKPGIYDMGAPGLSSADKFLQSVHDHLYGDGGNAENLYPTEAPGSNRDVECLRRDAPYDDLQALPIDKDTYKGIFGASPLPQHAPGEEELGHGLPYVPWSAVGRAKNQGEKNQNNAAGIRERARTKRATPKGTSNLQPPSAAIKSISGNATRLEKFSAMQDEKLLIAEYIGYLQDETTRNNYFPNRTNRRMRTWAGVTVPDHIITSSELQQLPSYPSEQRAFPRREGAADNTGPGMMTRSRAKRATAATTAVGAVNVSGTAELSKGKSAKSKSTRGKSTKRKRS